MNDSFASQKDYVYSNLDDFRKELGFFIDAFDKIQFGVNDLKRLERFDSKDSRIGEFLENLRGGLRSFKLTLEEFKIQVLDRVNKASERIFDTLLPTLLKLHSQIKLRNYVSNFSFSEDTLKAEYENFQVFKGQVAAYKEAFESLLESANEQAPPSFEKNFIQNLKFGELTSQQYSDLVASLPEKLIKKS